MLVHPLLRTDEHIEDEHAPHVQSFYFLLTDALLWTKRDILDTPLVAPSSIGVVHGKGQLRKKNICATCHFLTSSCHFICPGQLPIYSGIPPLPSTFAKFSPLTFLV